MAPTTRDMEHMDRNLIDYLRTWLSNRRRPNDDIDYYQSNVIIHPNEFLRSHAFPDLHLNRYKSVTPLKKQVANKFDLNNLFKWMNEFVILLRENRPYLEAIEFMRFGFNKKLGRHHVQEAINLVQGALTFDVALDIQTNQEFECILIDESSIPMYIILRQICVRLFAQCQSIKVLTKVNHYYNCLLTAFIVDLLEQAKVPPKLIEMLVHDNRRSTTFDLNSPQLNNTTISSLNLEKVVDNSFNWSISPASSKKTKLSLVAICFNGAEISRATKLILESYLLHQVHHPNQIILVEEAIYGTFVSDWKFNYTKVMSSLENSDWSIDIQTDLNCIDIKLAHRMAGHCINVIKFRSVEDLCKLMNNSLRKIPHIQLWTQDYQFAKQICLLSSHINQCDQFWLNHLPLNLAGRQFSEHLIKYFKSSMKQHMDYVYSNAYHYFDDEIERLRKLQITFATKKSRIVAVQQVLKVYLNLISKFKSMKTLTSSISESVLCLKRFQLYTTNILIGEHSNDSRIETLLKPTGLAILVIRDYFCIKSKSVLIEFIFKNLLIGNAVLLVCPPNLLGQRFPVDMLKRHHIPFGMLDVYTIATVNEVSQFQSTPQSEGGGGGGAAAASSSSSPPPPPSPSQVTQADKTSTDASFLGTSIDSELNETTTNVRKSLKCPKSVYAIEFRQGEELTSAKVDNLVLALGCKRKSIWSFMQTVENESSEEEEQVEEEEEEDVVEEEQEEEEEEQEQEEEEDEESE